MSADRDPDRRRTRRLVLATLALAALAASAGCLGYVTGGGEIGDATLDEEPPEPYEWDVDRDAYIVVRTDATFQAVYRVDGRESVRLYRSTGYGTEEPPDLESFRYRYPNGTVITGSEFRDRGGEIEQTTDEIHVRFPPEMREGRFAFRASSIPKRFTLPVYVEGSYEVVLPPDRRIDFPVFGTAAPRGYETVVRGDRQHVRWEEVTSGTILVQFYLQRDLYIFAVVVVVATLIGTGGALYYRRQLRRLQETREELGLDVEVEDDDEFDDDPPPGMG